MIIKETISMKKLHRERDLYIYLPDNYSTSGKRYPVLYINDGQNAFFDEESYSGVSWGFLDFVRERQLDLIMVAIPCNFEPWMREAEYGVWKTDPFITIHETGRREPGLGGEGKAYVKFLIEELKEYMDSNYPTDPQDTAIVGSSAGANISIYAAVSHPHIFRKCAALSTAFWYYPKEYDRLIRKADLAPLECFYLDRGSQEGNGDEFVNKLYQYENDHIYELLKEKGLGDRLHYRVYEGACHNEAEWRKRVPVFMDLFYH